MNNDKQETKVSTEENSNTNKDAGNNQEKHLHNPFNGKEMDITQEDIDNEQKYKEALTERD